MGLFKKKDRVIDLTKKYKQDQERAKRISASPTVSSNSGNSEASPFGGWFGIFGNADPSTTATPATNSESSSNGYVDFSSGDDDKKKKLAKRLMAMTDKLEDISNQIYHLQQRLEVIERKMDIGRY